MDIVSTLTVRRGKRIDGDQGQNSIGVFEAFDPQLGMEVALKEISKHGRSAVGFFEEAQRMFESEHPNVVPIRTACETASTIMLVMPLYRNGSLKTKIATQPLSICQTIKVGREILAGTGAIHAGGSVHFDIKVGNVLIGDNGVAKVADFGQARELGPNGFALMPDRMYAPTTPPEAFTNNRVGSPLSDIFQVGATLYQAVNGQSFFDQQLLAIRGPDGLRNAILSGRFPSRDKFLPHVPDRLRRVLRKAMRTDPADRFHSDLEFANALKGVLPTLNWAISYDADGTTRWDANRFKRPTLRILLRPVAQTCGVEIYTVSKGKPRATQSGLWKSGLNKKSADAYLNQLFEAQL